MTAAAAAEAQSKADAEEAEARAEAEGAAAAAAAEAAHAEKVAAAEKLAAAEKAAALEAAREAALAEEEAAQARAEAEKKRPKLTSLGISSVFRPSSPETERKPGVPWGQGDLKRTGSDESSAPSSEAAQQAEPFKLNSPKPPDRRQSVNVERRPLGVSAQRQTERLDNWDRDVPQHKVSNRAN